MRFGEHSLPDQNDGRADGKLAIEFDRERVHRDGADDAPQLSTDTHFGAGQIAAEPVRVPERHEADPRGLLRDEAAPVTGALAGLQQLHLREVAVPGEHGLEPIRRGVGAEGRQSVDRDPAARCIET